MKQVAKKQERNYQTTEVFDCHIGSPMTSQLVMTVKKILSGQQLQAGILLVITQFSTYLQFMSMGVNYWAPAIVEPTLTPVSATVPIPAA